MKKILALLLAALMMFSLVSCGEETDSGSSESSNETSGESSSERSDESSSEESEDSSSKSEDESSSSGSSDGSSSASSGTSSTTKPDIQFDAEAYRKERAVSAYVNTVTSTSIWSQQVAAIAKQGMTLTLSSKGTELIYTYKYTVDVVDNASEVISANLASMREDLKASADVIRADEPAISKVTWSYYDKNGKLLATISL